MLIEMFSHSWLVWVGKKKAQDEVDTDFAKVKINLEFMSKNSAQIKDQL